MRHRFRALVGFVLIGTLCLPAAAQWKWRDKGGQTQYSDIPPPQGTPDANILQRPAGAKSRNAVTVVSTPASAVAASAASAAAVPASGIAAPKTADPELEARIKKVEDEKLAKAKAENDKIAAQKADNCARARSHMKVLDDGMRMARVNAQIASSPSKTKFAACGSPR
jgi:hypothetical protein